MNRPSNRRRWFRPVLRAAMPGLREAAFLSLFVNLLALATPLFVFQVYDRVVFYAGLNTLRGLVAGVLIAILFDFILRQARSRLLQRVALRLDVEISRNLFKKVTAVTLPELERRPTPYWQALFRDVETVRNFMSGASMLLLADIPFALLFVGLIVLIAAPIAWVFAVIVPIFMLLAWRAASRQSAASREERQASYERDALIGEMIGGRTTVKAMALDRAMAERWEGRHADAIELSVRRGGAAEGYVNIGTAFTVLTTVAITSAGALAIIDQQLTIGAVIASNMLGARIIAPFQQLVVTWRGFAGFRGALRRLGDAFALPDDQLAAEMAVTRPVGDLALDKVSFSHDPRHAPAVAEITMKVRPGGLHGLVGPNGSGKTTLLKLLQGLYAPDEGRVLLDDADIGQFSRQQLARWIGYVPQDGHLFAGSIRDNIALKEPGVDDDEVIAAATLAGVHQEIIDLPDGYGTDIGEAGGRLSGGLRQRVAIARALLGDPPILLLDEPSSNLDRRSEEALRDQLVRMSEDHNIILVTHSPVLLQACRNIVALSHGRLALAGPTEEVLPRLMQVRDAGPAPARQLPAGATAKPA